MLCRRGDDTVQLCNFGSHVKDNPLLSHVYGAWADVMTNIKSFSTEMFKKEAQGYVSN